MSETTVEYRDIPGFPGYQAGSDGSIWTNHKKGRHNGQHRIEHGVLWRKMKANTTAKGTSGYPYVSLRKNGKYVGRKVHQLVLLAFVGPRPAGLTSRHVNGNKVDAQLTNLAYGTWSENMRDKTLHGTDNRGERCASNKLSQSQVLQVVELVKSGKSQSEIATACDVAPSTIQAIADGSNWSWLTGGKVMVPANIPRQKRFGNRHHAAAINESLAREIKRLLGCMRQIDIAHKFGVNPGLVNRIATGKTWKHVTV